MKQISINDATKISNKLLKKLGFDESEYTHITNNLIDAEMSGKRTHGLIRLLAFKKKNDENKLNKEKLKVDILNESPASLYIDGHNKLGYAVFYESLKLAINKVKKYGITTVGIKNIGMNGYIGGYARIAAENNLIFIGFNSSPKGLVPYGAKKDLWGTNPLTISIPGNDGPVILDMASTNITWGDIMIAINEGKTLKQGSAIDAEGKPTTDPATAMKGGLLPFAGHKGSGLGFMVELLGGALTGSRVGYSVPGNGGTFYILVNPELFLPVQQLKNTIDIAINELKNAPKMDGFNEIYFPGEKSNKRRKTTEELGLIDMDVTLLEKIDKYLE